MRYVVSHLGVPIGRVDLTQGDSAVGELVATAAYDAVRNTIRSASEVLWAIGFLGSGQTANNLDPAALGRAQALPLELRDERGVFVPTDFINVVERPSPAELPVVFVRFRLASANVAAINETQSRNDGESSRRGA
jgi:hypothetical protein